MKLLACSGVSHIADDVARSLDEKLLSVSIERYSDGEMQVVLQESVKGMHVFVMQSLSGSINNNIMELLVNINALKREKAGKITVVIPYLCYSRQVSRRSGEFFTVKLLTDIFRVSGADEILILDAHEDSLIKSSVVPLYNMSPVELLVDSIKKHEFDRDIVIVSPDKGRFNLVKSIAYKLNVNYACIKKERDRFNKIVKMELLGAVRDKHCIIIDDIVDSAATLLKAVKVLLEGDASQVSGYVTHGVLTGSALVDINKSSLRNLYVTNSIDIVKKIEGEKKIKILNIAPLIAQQINRLKWE